LASCLLRPMSRNSVLEELSVRRFAVIQDEIWSRALWRWSMLTPLCVELHGSSPGSRLMHLSKNWNWKDNCCQKCCCYIGLLSYEKGEFQFHSAFAVTIFSFSVMVSFWQQLSFQFQFFDKCISLLPGELPCNSTHNGVSIFCCCQL